MKRVVIVVAALLVAGIIGIAVFLYNNINTIVKGAIEKNGSAILSTDVSVGSVDISLKSGRGTIRNVKVRNPEGFDGDAFALGEITVGIAVASLNKDPIVIDEVTIRAPDVRVILDKAGRSNMTALKDAADRYQASSAKRPEGKQDGGYEKRFRIARFEFEEGRVVADASAMDRGSIETALPPLRLADVGGRTGDTPDGIGKTVSRAFVGAVMSAVTDELKGRVLDEGKDAATKALEKLLD